MKRFLWVIVIGIAMLSMLCIGIAIGGLYSPVKDGISRLIEPIFSRAENRLRVEPRVQILRPEFMDQGILILEVTPSSPAEKAGLKAGMIITALEGQAPKNVNDLATALAEYKPGDRVQLTVKEAGEEQDVTVTLGENPEKAGKAWIGIRLGLPAKAGPPWIMPGMPEGDQPMPALPPGWLDRLPEGELPFGRIVQPGALIREVVTGSPAEKAGLKPGQVIQAVDGQAVDSDTALPDSLAKHKPGDTVILTVFDPTQGSAQTQDVKVTLGENPDKAGAAWLGIAYIYLDLKQPEQPILPEG